MYEQKPIATVRYHTNSSMNHITLTDCIVFTGARNEPMSTVHNASKCSETQQVLSLCTTVSYFSNITMLLFLFSTITHKQMYMLCNSVMQSLVVSHKVCSSCPVCCLLRSDAVFMTMSWSLVHILNDNTMNNMTRLTPSRRPVSATCAHSYILCTSHQNNEASHRHLQHDTHTDAVCITRTTKQAIDTYSTAQRGKPQTPTARHNEEGHRHLQHGTTRQAIDTYSTTHIRTLYASPGQRSRP